MGDVEELGGLVVDCVIFAFVTLREEVDWVAVLVIDADEEVVKVLLLGPPAVAGILVEVVDTVAELVLGVTEVEMALAESDLASEEDETAATDAELAEI